MQANLILPSCLIALGASALTLAGQRLFPDAEQPEPIEQALAPAQEPWLQVLGTLERIEKQLSANQLASPGPTREVIRLSPNAEGEFQAPPKHDLQAILQRLDSIARRIPAPILSEDQTNLDLDFPVNHTALTALAYLENTDKKKASQNVFLISADEVIRKYGFPHHTRLSDERYDYVWTYKQDPNAKKSKSLRFYFSAHRVVRMESAWDI